MFALDMDNKRFWAGNNGTWYNAGNPATAAAPLMTGLSGTVFPGITFYARATSNAFNANFGGQGGANNGFNYTPPTGFNPGLYNIPATWDPNWSVAGVNYTNGNLSIASGTTATTDIRTNIGRNAGRFYWELTATAGDGSTDSGGVGLMDSTAPNTNSYLGSSANSFGFGYGSCCSAQYYSNWTGTTPGTAPTLASAIKAGNIYTFALDLTTGSLWVGNNGTWYSGTPGSATPALKGITGLVYPGVVFYPSSINAFTANFGQQPFSYGPPPGYGAGFY
jgi:hypothetical protein